MRARFVPLLLALATLAPACMWDTDTLAEEASFGKDFIATIVGRFPRNPPLYYAMRRDRLLAKRVLEPEEIDDLAVAYERLGDSLAALKWIDRKPHGSSETEYRTHANRGTFLVHAWLRGQLGRDAGERGVRELDEALKINPDAHFGRERVQVALVQRLLKPKENNTEADNEPLKSAIGYAGIVRLGSGWESPDVFRMMAIDLAAAARPGPHRLGAVTSLALMRADELVHEGHRPRLDDPYGFGMVEGVQTPSLESETRREYTRLRREADEWQARRTAFMAARLKGGRHPDTDSTFWQGWTDTSAPEVQAGWITRTFGMAVPWYWVALGVVLIALCATVPMTVIFLVLRSIWRAAAKLKRS